MTNGEKNTTQHRMTTTHNDNNTDIVATDTHDKWREKHNSTQNDNNTDIVATDTHDKWREKHNSTQNDNNS